MRTVFKTKTTKSKRTKFPKSKRVKRVRTKFPGDDFVKPGSIFNRGGFLINPPADCMYRGKCKDGGIWVDAVICLAVCKNKCAFYHKYCDMSHDERIAYRRKHGVRIYGD